MRPIMLAAALTLAATPVLAEGISTHVLDLARGVGGAGVPVTLEKEADGEWETVGEAKTQDNGRVEDFGVETENATYRLTFDMRGYEGEAPFFPEIGVTFNVDDPSQHYHVPVVVSPYGYSTYRGN